MNPQATSSQQANQKPAETGEELLRTLGNICGVSELTVNNQDRVLKAPVLIAETAFVFLAWQE